MKRIVAYSLAAAAAAVFSQPMLARDFGGGRGDFHGSAAMSNRGVTVQPSMRSSSVRGMTPTRTVTRTVTRNVEPITRTDIDRGIRTWNEPPSVAYGGTRYVDRDRIYRSDRELRDRRDIRRPSFDVYRDWDRNRIYRWNNYRWRWLDNEWVMIGSVPGVTYAESTNAEPMYVEPSVTYSDEITTTSSLAADVQDALNSRGFNAGPEDGVIGPQTRNAISRYQATHGLSVTGEIDSSLLQSLGL